MLITTSSCKKDEDDTQPQPIATGQTGTLIIYVVESSTNLPKEGVDIGLYYDYSYNNGTHLYSLSDKKTDAQGKIDFGELNSGNYWTKTGSNSDRKQVQVIAGKENIYTLKR